MPSIPDLPDLVDTAIAQAAIRLAQSTESPSVFKVHSGVGADFGRNADFIDDKTAAAIHADYPRLSMASTLVDAIAAHAQRSPDAAPPYSMPGEVLRERRTDGITLMELMASHGRWGD